MVHLHKKNLETLMKSRNEFTTKEEYNEYLRTYFAGLAMQAMISNPNIIRPKESDEDFIWFSERAIRYADELLKQLENELNLKTWNT